MQINPAQAATQALTICVGNLPTFIAVLLAWMNSNSRTPDLKSSLEAKINDKFEILNTKTEKNFELTSLKIDSLRESLSGDLRRVEEVMDARLKHLEEPE